MSNNELVNLDELFYRSKEIVRVAREITGTVANLTTVISNYEIGRYLVEEDPISTFLVPLSGSYENRKFR